MRKPLLLFLAFSLLTHVQLSWVNLAIPSTTFNVPFTVLVLLAPLLTPRAIAAAAAGVALTLDYASALPFGSYLISLAVTLFLLELLTKRLPIRQHRLFRLLTVATGSLLMFGLLLSLTTALVVLGLAPFTFTYDGGLLRSLLEFLLWNMLFAMAAFLLIQLTRRLLAPRLFLPHETH